MAGFCAVAMVTSMVAPVWAADEEAAEEDTADDGDVADVSEAMTGIWQDSAGDIYGFYKDNSFFGQWKDEEQDILSNPSQVSLCKVPETILSVQENRLPMLKEKGFCRIFSGGTGRNISNS